MCVCVCGESPCFSFFFYPPDGLVGAPFASSSCETREMQMRPPLAPPPPRFPPPPCLFPFLFLSLVDKWRPSLGRQISTNKTRLTGHVTTIFKINRHSSTVHLSVRLGPESFLPSFLQLALFSSSRQQHFGRDGIFFFCVCGSPDRGKNKQGSIAAKSRTTN